MWETLKPLLIGLAAYCALASTYRAADGLLDDWANADGRQWVWIFLGITFCGVLMAIFIYGLLDAAFAFAVALVAVY